MALGKKPVVIPGTKNNIMAFVTKHFVGVSMGINFGGKMMEKARIPGKF